MEPQDIGLWYATSRDGGLTFSNEYKVSFPSAFSNSFGNDPDVFLDKSGNMILWAGGFESSFGGYIGAVKLAKSTSAGSGSSAVKSAPTTKVTITCVKGKVIKKITSTKPVCPAGYKKK